MNAEVIEMFQAEAIAALPQSFLGSMYQWGIEVIRVIQRIESPALTVLIKFITALGTEAFYIPMILFIFWWIDEKQGLRFGILVVLSGWINSVVKDLLKQPRPYNLVPSLGMAFESSYGAPSGHAQNSLVFWIPMAAWLSRKVKGKFASAQATGKNSAGENPERKQFLIWAGVVFFVLLIGFTRLYLGVHFPTDLFAGWTLGGIILVLCFIPGPKLEKLFARAGARSQNICIAVIALVMNGLYPRDRSLAALFLGFGIGYTLMKTRFPFFARGEINGKKPGVQVMIFRCLIGFAGMVAIYIGLKLVFPGEGSLFSGIPVWGPASPFYEIGRFVRYGLLGLWASAGAPWIFRRMGLANNSAVPASGKDDSGNNKES